MKIPQYLIDLVGGRDARGVLTETPDRLEGLASALTLEQLDRETGYFHTAREQIDFMESYEDINYDRLFQSFGIVEIAMPFPALIEVDGFSLEVAYKVRSFRAKRARTLQVLRGLTDEELTRSTRFPHFDQIAVGDLLVLLAGWDLRSLGVLQTALER